MSGYTYEIVDPENTTESVRVFGCFVAADHPAFGGDDPHAAGVAALSLLVAPPGGWPQGWLVRLWREVTGCPIHRDPDHIVPIEELA